MNDGPLLEVGNLVTEIRRPDGPIRVVDDVSFTLERGETLGIVGESGSGKSMLAKSIMRLLGPSTDVSGRIAFSGRSLEDLRPRELRHFWGTQVAMIFQDPMTSLNPVKRVGRAITESLEFHLHVDHRSATRRAIDLFEEVGIPEPAKRIRCYPHELSGGMRQRVMIAMALACRPQLLIADEPTTALDVTVQRQILDLLKSLQVQYDMGLVLITHELGVVANRTDRVAVMYAGKFVETANTVTLFESTRHRYTQALLASIPRLDTPSGQRLQSIPGRPPSPSEIPPGCRFAPRCTYSHEQCALQEPAMAETLSASHQFACHFPVDMNPKSHADKSPMENVSDGSHTSHEG